MLFKIFQLFLIFFSSKQDSFDIIHSPFYTSVLKRNRQSCMLQSLKITHTASAFTQLQVIRPRLVMIYPILCRQFHCPHCREDIIDIVKWIQKYMQLMIPVTAPVKEIIGVILPPGHIDLFKLLPLQGSLFWRKLWILITDMLKLIHSRPKGHQA